MGAYDRVTAFFGGKTGGQADHKRDLHEDWKNPRYFVYPPNVEDLEVAQWVAKTKAEMDAGRIQEAILWLPNKTDSDWFAMLSNEPNVGVCFPKKKQGGSRVLVGYIGDRVAEFKAEYSDLGPVWCSSPHVLAH